jgi:hypothetical protein
VNLLTRRKLPGLLLAVFAAISIPATPAQAHYVYSQADVYRSTGPCVTVRSETSHGTNNDGYFKNNMYSKWGLDQYQTACGNAFARPAGYLTMKNQIYKWDGYQWTMCVDRAWVYNSTTTSSMQVLNNPGYLLCGPGYYGLQTGDFIYNGGWYGGSLWSGYHYLPA